MSIVGRMVLEQIFQVSTRGPSLRRRCKVDGAIGRHVRIPRSVKLRFIDTTGSMSRRARWARARFCPRVPLCLRAHARKIRRGELHTLVATTTSRSTPSSIITRRKIA